MRATKFSLPGLLLLILLFSGGFSVIAQVPYLERKISGNFKETPADQALKQISDQGGFTFSYGQQDQRCKTADISIQEQSCKGSIGPSFFRTGFI